MSELEQTTFENQYKCAKCNVVVGSEVPEKVCLRCGTPLTQLSDEEDEFTGAIAAVLVEAHKQALIFTMQARQQFSRPSAAVLAHVIAAKNIMRLADMGPKWSLEVCDRLIEETLPHVTIMERPLPRPGKT